jgi:hypothetical protein
METLIFITTTSSVTTVHSYSGRMHKGHSPGMMAINRRRQIKRPNIDALLLSVEQESESIKLKGNALVSWLHLRITSQQLVSSASNFY